MEALDGNAIAGVLFEHFGVEMTTSVGTCPHCGAATIIARLVVYVCAPGAVARCPGCGQVVMVVLDAPDHPRVEASGFTIAIDERR